MRYFDHDTSASDDDKIMALRIECGGAAVDAYWAVLELMYRDETDLVFSENQPKTKALTHRLCVGFDQLRTWVSAMVSVGLLEVVSATENDVENSTVYRSPRAASNIENYSAKKETARQNGKKGGRKPKANRTLTESVPKPKPNGNRRLTEPLAKEKEKVLVTHKGLPNTSASCDAAAAVAAPPAAEADPRCPMCEARCVRNTNTGRWECTVCHDTWSAGEVLRL